MEVRADTWLWAIRIYKSRTLASEAIKGGKVKLKEQNFKPSHLVKIGERFTVRSGDEIKIIEVLGLTDQRSNFETAKKFYINHTVAQDPIEKLASVFFKTNIRREKGLGRPTKKDRRDIRGFNEEA